MKKKNEVNFAINPALSFSLSYAVDCGPLYGDRRVQPPSHIAEQCTAHLYTGGMYAVHAE